jgi:hypothetical protein
LRSLETDPEGGQSLVMNNIGSGEERLILGHIENFTINKDKKFRGCRIRYSKYVTLCFCGKYFRHLEGF